MSHRTRHGSVSAVVRLGGLVAALLLALLVSAAPAAVLKNKQTGQTLKGTLTDQVINGLRVFVLEDGTKKFLKLDEWEIIVADAPGTEPPKPAATPKPAAEEPKKPEEKKPPTVVYVIPIKGPIMYHALVANIDKAIKEAKTKKAEYILFHLDTPGGRVDLGDKIIGLIDSIDFAHPLAWVEGNEMKGAISCGAYISLCAEAIYMAKGTTIGAATPYTHNMTTGSAEVDEKYQSVFRARFRALAEKRGHPPVMVDAMVDSSVSVVQVFIDGQQQFVTEDDARRLAEEHKGDGKFKRGKTVCRSGKILTLTAAEALEYTLCKALAETPADVMKAVGVEDFKVVDCTWLPDAVKKKAEADKNRFEKARNVFNANFEQARLTDPAMMLFPDQRGTARWKDLSKRCMGYLQNCAAALTEIEKIAADENSDYPVPKDEIDELKSRLEAFYQRIKADA